MTSFTDRQLYSDFFPLQNSTVLHLFVDIYILLYAILPLDQSSVPYTLIWFVILPFPIVCIKDSLSLYIGQTNRVTTHRNLFLEKNC